MSNVADPPSTTAGEHRDAQMYALQARLQGQGRETALVGGALAVYGTAPAQGGPRPVVTITCKPRVIDQDRLWFWDGDEPVAEASHVVDAAMAITARLGARS